RREAVDRRADVYALGAVLWEALTLRRLVEGEDRAALTRAALCEPEPPSRYAPAVNGALDAAVLAALAPGRAGRPPTARAFREADTAAPHAACRERRRGHPRTPRARRAARERATRRAARERATRRAAAARPRPHHRVEPRPRPRDAPVAAAPRPRRAHGPRRP